eukprot:1131702-Pleurochrysis_carterae.AAC.1
MAHPLTPQHGRHAWTVARLRVEHREEEALQRGREGRRWRRAHRGRGGGVLRVRAALVRLQEQAEQQPAEVAHVGGQVRFGNRRFLTKCASVTKRRAVSRNGRAARSDEAQITARYVAKVSREQSESVHPVKAWTVHASSMHANGTDEF